MANCPVCQTENTGDGLVNCVSCGSPFFVDFDGSVIPSESPAPVAAAPEPVNTPDPAVEAPEPALEFVSAPPELSQDAPPSPADFLAAPAVSEVAQDTPGEPPPVPPSNDEFEDLFAAPAAPPPVPEAPTPIEDLRDLAKYGNSDVSQAREGAYRFNITIRGIDTAEIRQAIRHELADSRFLWDIEALLATVTDGELIINDVPAVKAALAIQRLKLLPVEIKWEQYAIHQDQ